MRLTSVAVEGVGCFGVPNRIIGLGAGVNILAAGNEAGKSTLFKAIRACLFERHTTKVDFVKNLATEGLSLPVTVTLGFEHAGKTYELCKSFIKSPSASLRRDGVLIARAREADETVWEILGLAPGGGRAVDEAAFGLLWVAQGQSFQVPEPSDAARTALNTAIQNEVGTLVGGERARQILASLNADLSRLITDKGKPKTGGALGEAAQRLAAIGADLAATEGKFADLDHHLADYEKARAERRNLADPALSHRMASDLEEARAALTAGRAAAAILGQCVTDEELAHALLKTSRSSFIGLQERAARIDANRRRRAAFQSEFAPLDVKEAAARGSIAGASADIAALVQKADVDDAAERALQRLSGTIERLATREDLASRLTALTGLEDRLSRNEAAQNANKVTQAVAATLDDIERELGNLTARLEAGASRVAIEFLTASPPSIRIDGESVASGTTRPVIDPVTIVVADMAKITVMPPAGSLAAANSQRLDITARLKHLLDGCGATNPAELRRARASRQVLETEARGLDAERAVFGLKKLNLSGEIARLRPAIGAIDADLAQALADLNLEALPGRDEVEQARRDLAESRKSDRDRRAGLDTIIDLHNKALGSIATDRGRLRGTQAEIHNQLDADLALLPDETRNSLITQAEEAWRKHETDHRIKAVFVEERRRDTPSADEIERRSNRVARLETAIENQKSALGELDRRIANLEGQIHIAGGDGLGEKLSELRDAHGLAQRDLDRQTARVETLKLLRDVIETSYNSRREQLHAPLRRHLLPYLNDIFPQAEIGLGDGFAITGLKRPGPSSEEFDRLSAGTQEQIAVLVRLAMGAMICERGHEVPIILDDALVFSDDARIEQMFDALSRAGQKQQVIILTCRTRTFAALGGRQLSIANGI